MQKPVRRGSRRDAPRARAAPSPAAPGSAAAARAKPAPGRTPRRRRSFSQRTLAAVNDGPLGALLQEALTVPDEPGYALTHAFHPYPGRFHPALPRTVLQAVAQRGEAVLDPFMGGGTTLVEAMRQGLAVTGNDLNPIATLVARERTRPRTAEEARALTGEAHRIAAAVEALRREKHPPRVHRRHGRRLGAHYAPHLLAELMQWSRLIDAAPGGPLRESLHAVFSSAVVKFSNLESDSRAQPGATPRYPKGAVSRFLVDKAHELTRAQVALAAELAPDAPPPVLLQEDARLLPSLGWGAFAHVLTSPPYPGTYDYWAQHRLRMDWLELDDGQLAERELGARRHGGHPAGPAEPGEAPAEAAGGWSEGLRQVLGTLARVLRPGGNLFLVLGDWVADGHAVDAVAMLTRVAGAKDWSLESRASVQRAVHSRAEAKAYARRGKWEHLLHFSRPGAAVAPPPRQRTPRQRRET